MADIFLSYKKEDLEIAERLATALSAEGLEVWWDDDLTPRESWDATIEKELNRAATVVVLWSSRSVASEWVRREAHFGQDRGKLVPVMIERCTIPFAFTLNQAVDLIGWNGDRANRQWRKLLVWIANLTATKPGNANIPSGLAPDKPNIFLEAIGQLASGDRIVDGDFVNFSTPPGTVFRDGEALPVMRTLPKGSFLLGSSAADPDRTSYEGPQIRVEIPTPFALGVFPVLAGEYEHLVQIHDSPATPAPAKKSSWFARRPIEPSPTFSRIHGKHPELPVTDISFDDAQAYVEKLSQITQKRYRIPSEAEWEYACRAGSTARYCFGDIIDSSKAIYSRPSGPSRPGTCSPNVFGLYDMHGNVREWVADLWHESYEFTPIDARPATGGHSAMRVVRGGGWSDNPTLLRSACRMRATQTVTSGVIGLRVARSLD